MSLASTTDIHALYASRAIAKARTFVRSASAGGAGGSGGNGANGGGGVLSKSPNMGGWGGGGGNADKAAIAAEVNRRDYLGRTVLHLAVIESEPWALDWVELLLGVPGLAVNAQDTESGWSALHRALYAGVRLHLAFFPYTAPMLTVCTCRTLLQPECFSLATTSTPA